jgi:hypothetical protein
MFATAVVFTVVGCMTGAIPLAGKATPAAKKRELAPAAPMVFARCGAWTAGAETVVLLNGDAAELVRTAKVPIEVRLPAGAVVGEAVAVALLEDRATLVAAVRLDRRGAAAFMRGLRDLDASFEGERRQGALVPTAVHHFTLCQKGRWQ